jgi:hypothetical protein
MYWQKAWIKSNTSTAQPVSAVCVYNWPSEFARVTAVCVGEGVMLYPECDVTADVSRAVWRVAGIVLTRHLYSRLSGWPLQSLSAITQHSLTGLTSWTHRSDGSFQPRPLCSWPFTVVWCWPLHTFSITITLHSLTGLTFWRNLRRSVLRCLTSRFHHTEVSTATSSIWLGPAGYEMSPAMVDALSSGFFRWVRLARSPPHE